MTQLRAYRFLTSLAKAHGVSNPTIHNWKNDGKLDYVTVVSDHKLQDGKKARKPTEYKAWFVPLTITTVQGRNVTENHSNDV